MRSGWHLYQQLSWRPTGQVSMATKRKRVEPAKTMHVLVRSRRRCAVCFGLSRDVGIKLGQIAHLDRNPSNNDPDNLCFLCFEHHELYDSKASQAKGYTALEVVKFRKELDSFFGSQEFWPGLALPPSTSHDSGKRRGIELEVYDRRIAIYRSLRRILISILTDPGVKIDALRSFAEETDEALFLFDEEVARYLDQVYQQAVKLRAVGQRLNHPETLSEKELHALVQEDSELLNWISGQFTESRNLFRQYLALGPAPNPAPQRTADAAR